MSTKSASGLYVPKTESLKPSSDPSDSPNSDEFSSASFPLLAAPKSPLLWLEESSSFPEVAASLLPAVALLDESAESPDGSSALCSDDFELSESPSEALASAALLGEESACCSIAWPDSASLEDVAYELEIGVSPKTSTTAIMLFSSFALRLPPPVTLFRYIVFLSLPPHACTTDNYPKKKLRATAEF